MSKQFGITVMPEYVQSEGIGAVLDNLCRAGATSVTTSPYVAAEVGPGEGSREPPADAGAGNVRLLDRPLWGKREVYMQTAPSFVPEIAAYSGLRYQPPAATALTGSQGAVVRRFIDEAARSGLETWLQVMAASPPALRVQFGGPSVEDQPMLPDGALGPVRVDRNASLASVELRRYMAALIGDLCRNYPAVTGLKFDWPEIPPYAGESLLFDFNPAVRPFAEALGLDLDALADRVRALSAKLAGLDDRTATALLARTPALGELIGREPALADLFRLRRHLVADYQRFLAETLRAASNGRQRVFFQGFPPPLDTLSGFDYATAGELADDVGAKIYTMHWPMIERNYAAALLARSALTESGAIRLVHALLGATDQPVERLEHLAYPAPDEVHPAHSHGIEGKLMEARRQVGRARFWALSHGYGPLPDVERRFLAALNGSGGSVYLNRYCYLSDDKLAALGAIHADFRGD